MAKLVEVSPELHNGLRKIAALTGKKLKSVVDELLSPPVLKRLATLEPTKKEKSK